MHSVWLHVSFKVFLFLIGDREHPCTNQSHLRDSKCVYNQERSAKTNGKNKCIGKVYIQIFREMFLIFLIPKKIKQLRVDRRVPTSFERFEKVYIKPVVAFQTKRRANVACLPCCIKSLDKRCFGSRKKRQAIPYLLCQKYIIRNCNKVPYFF